MRRFVLLGLMVASIACAQDAVSIDSGKLKGATTEGITSFKGVPYAAPPVGDLRWRDPQPVAKWDGVRAATEFGADCLQAGKVQSPKTSEDCLFLNVWRPEKITGKIPVMVWIHGGGFVAGGSSAREFEGTQFAKRGVILVSLNYRLGRFGFFVHPALTAAAGKDEVLGNYGLADQVAALRWVQRNIAAFGGDAKKVTIFGESAGGFSVQALLTSPLTKGLFSQAIVESGAGRVGKERGEATASIAVAEKTGVAFAKSVGIEGTGPEALTKLRALAPEKIKGDLTMGTSKGEADTYSGPVVDGKLSVGVPADVYARGGGWKVPLMIGGTSEDMGAAELPGTTPEAVFAAYGTHAAAAKAAYDPSGNANVRAIKVMAGADAAMLEPARYAAKIYSSRGLPVYEYRFSYVPVPLRAMMTGAKHASELAFVFDTLPPRKELTAADKAMADTMNAYWAAFGRTGDPNGEGRPFWPKYDAKTDMLMDFTNEGPKAMADPRKAGLDVAEAVALGK